MADDLESFGFVGTINDDEELKFDDETSESDEEQVVPLTKQKKKLKRKTDFNHNFQFDFTLKDESSFDADFALRHAKKKKLEVTSLDDKISKIRTEKKKSIANDKDKSVENEDWAENNDSSEEDSAEEINVADIVRDKTKKKKKIQKARR